MAQTPQSEAREQQHSAMFEALATTSFAHDEICSLLPSQQHLPASSSSAQNSSSASSTGGNNATSSTQEQPYSERGTETGNEDKASVPVVKSWWVVAMKWAGWDRRPKVYRAVRQ